MAWQRFFRRARWDEERARELQDYLTLEIDDNVARGMSDVEARRAAHLKLGNTARIREEIYEMNSLPVLDLLWQDLKYGVRVLRKNPGFAVAAILTLALGTGANAAMFQLLSAVRLQPLPVGQPHELVSVGTDRHGKGRVGRGYRGRSIYSEPLWRAIQSHQHAFTGLLAWGSSRWDLSQEGESQPAEGLYVSGSYFDVLGVRPHIGRLLTASDDHRGCDSPGAVLSHTFWQSRYGGDQGVLGRNILIDRRPFQVIGVAPAGFFGVEVGRAFDVAIPLCAEALIRGSGSGVDRADVWWLDIVGRLPPDWTIERANAHLATISPAVFETTVPTSYNAEYSRDYRAFTLTATPAARGVSDLRNSYTTELWVLLGATTLLLVLTCANLANLMLARASARAREIAVRLAIGASRRRVIRQLLSESLLIAVAGAAGGLLLAGWISRALVTFLSTEGSQVFVDLAFDWRLFGFMTLVAAAACVLFGLSPALSATNVDPARAMQAGGRSGTDSRQAFAFRRGLVVVQIALSMVLVVGALLFGRSLRNLGAVELGFDPNIVAAYVDLRRTPAAVDAHPQLVADMLDRVRAVPGVQNASETMIVPMSGAGWNGRIQVNGVIQPGEPYFNGVGADFFRTLNIPLRAGQTFDGRERGDALQRAVVNETFVARYFPGVNPLGQRFQLEAPQGRPQPFVEIIGVVGDTKYRDVREEPIAIAYVPMAQELPAYTSPGILVRSSVPPAALLPSLTRAIISAAPGAAVSYDTISQYVSELVVTERLMASLSGLFGVLALVIATVGLYGVVSYMVTRRRSEIGVRMALGADRRSVITMMLRESSALLLAGVAAGVVIAVLAARSAASLLYGMSPLDTMSFMVAIVVLAVVSLLAAWIPARRASRVSPTVALRDS